MVNFTCNSCQKKFRISEEYLSANKTVTCPICGQSLDENSIKYLNDYSSQILKVKLKFEEAAIEIFNSGNKFTITIENFSYNPNE